MRFVFCCLLYLATSAGFAYADDSDHPPPGVYCHSERELDPQYFVKALDVRRGLDVTVLRRTLGHDVDVFKPEATTERGEGTLTLHMTGEITADLVLTGGVDPHHFPGVFKLAAKEWTMQCHRVGG